MNYIRSYQILIVILCSTILSCDLFDNNSGIPTNEDIWVNAYLVSWQHNPQTDQINSGIVVTSDIDWNAMTHMTYFALSIAPDGTPELSLDPVFRHNFNSDRLHDIVTAAHANDTKILFSVGGSTNYEGFSTAIDSSRNQFIETISTIISTYGFDGVSLNMTPIELQDFANYRTFVRQLSNTFDTLRTTNNQRPLLTAGVTNASGMSSLYASIQKHFDQINILTYEMSRPWRGWVTWHQTPLYNRNNLILENTSQFFPSINLSVVEWVKSGVDRSKIGFSVSFYGSIWQNLHIQEKWDGWPTENQALYRVIPYSDLSKSYDLDEYEWDSQAHASFLQIDDPKSFISFDNEQSIRSKIDYIKSYRLGGFMIWDLSAGHHRNGSPANPLLDVIKPHVSK
jgi:chitinase